MGRKAVQDRMDRLDRLSATFGAALKEREEKAEAALQASIKRVQEEGERASKEDAERRKREHDRKVNDMLVVRAKQVKEAGKQQAEIFKQQLAEGIAKDDAKKEKARKARE